MVEITSEKQNKIKRMKRTEDSLRDVWDHIKCTNIQITGVPKEEEKKKGYEKIFEEIIVENFPNMEEEVIVSHSQSVQEVQSPIQDKPKEKQSSSIAQSCLTLCDPMVGNTPGLPVHSQLPKFTETHVH